MMQNSCNWWQLAPALMFLMGMSGWLGGETGAQPNWIGAGAKASHITLNYYAPQETKPLFTLRSDRIFGDYQTGGFFRIGVLPLLVVDGLQVEWHEPSRGFALLTNVPALLGRNIDPKGAFEIRRFSLTGRTPQQTLLTAQTVRVVDGVTWKLRNGRLLLPDHREVVFRRAALILAGPHAGDFTCETAQGNLRATLTAFSERQPAAKSP